MKKKSGFSFLMLVILILSASAVLAEEAGEIIIAGIELCAILSTLAAVVFGIAAVMCFKLVKKLYGGRFTAVLPYLLMAVVLLFGMQILDIIRDLNPVIDTHLYLHGMQVLQLLAGFFLISALYQVYQVRFATEGFIGGGLK